MNYSFLLGSGFSVAYGLPLVSTINQTFTNIKPEEFIIHSDLTAIFYDASKDPNDWMKENEKKFFIEFIENYCSIIGGKKHFNYEKFYDYYYKFLRGEEEKSITIFCEKFKKEVNEDHENLNLVNKFNITFSLLLANKLDRAELYDNKSIPKTYTKYGSFMGYLDILSDNNGIVNIHTLNHDLLLEYLCNTSNLYDKFCDGFSELGSSYYGEIKINNEIDKDYLVRVKQNSILNYEKNIRLYKLHGSIDLFSIDAPIDKNPERRIKRDYGVQDIYIEKPIGLHYKYERTHTNIYPDFLSGTTEKIRHYNDPYYKRLFNTFEFNLEKADKLIIIGYGFGDDGINKILYNKFISQGNIPIVITPIEPEHSFYRQHSFQLIEKKIEDLTIDELKTI